MQGLFMGLNRLLSGVTDKSKPAGKFQMCFQWTLWNCQPIFLDTPNQLNNI